MLAYANLIPVLVGVLLAVVGCAAFGMSYYLLKVRRDPETTIFGPARHFYIGWFRDDTEATEATLTRWSGQAWLLAAFVGVGLASAVLVSTQVIGQ